MSKMVERVARHIAGIAWGDIDDETRQFWLARARAAIAAMREPTEPMIEAGFGAGARRCDGILFEDFAKAWRAMIDAALAEPPKVEKE